VSRRKLLLADDSITIQKVVNLTFADEGVDVITVGDGDAALAELASGLPDILLADVNMPGPNGYEICEQLRSSEASRNLPVILLVGSFEPFDEAEASRVGANAYLTKPFQSIRQLVSQVNELIEAANTPVAEPSVEEAAILESEVTSETEDETSLSDTVEMSSSGIDSSEVAAETSAESAPGEIVDAAPRYFDDLGYETTLPPVETAAAVEPADEIESLYAQSISSGDDGLSDVGIDDEMIETSYSVESANDDLAEFRSEVEADSGSYDPGPSYAEHSVESVPETAGSEAPVFSSGYEQRFPEDPSKFENTISYQNWQPADMRSGDGQPAAAEAQQSFETTRLDESFPQENEGVTPGPTIGEDTIRMENRFETTGSAFQFDDVNLLDLSNNAEAPVEITSPVNAVEQGGSKQVVTLSPELIEMIAQRVVEKLSEKY
jgi:CheY-like chemotaxis protein